MMQETDTPRFVSVSVQGAVHRGLQVLAAFERPHSSPTLQNRRRLSRVMVVPPKGKTPKWELPVDTSVVNRSASRVWLTVRNLTTEHREYALMPDLGQFGMRACCPRAVALTVLAFSDSTDLPPLPSDDIFITGRARGILGPGQATVVPIYFSPQAHLQYRQLWQLGLRKPIGDSHAALTSAEFSQEYVSHKFIITGGGLAAALRTSSFPNAIEFGAVCLGSVVRSCQR